MVVTSQLDHCRNQGGAINLVTVEVCESAAVSAAIKYTILLTRRSIREDPGSAGKGCRWSNNVGLCPFCRVVSILGTLPDQRHGNT